MANPCNKAQLGRCTIELSLGDFSKNVNNQIEKLTNLVQLAFKDF